MQWLEHHYKEDFFLYIDVWDPHEPWDAPDFYTELYWPEDAGEVVMPRSRHWMEGIPLSGEDIEKAHAFYCGEVTMVDTWLGHFMRRLENMNLMDKTAILFTSDHGTYHGEHGGRFGKHTRVKPDDDEVGFGFCPLYEEVASSPLLVYVPDIAPGEYSGLASAIDLAPTVLDILGHETPSFMDGRSLLPAMKDSSVAGREYAISAAPFRTSGSPLKWVGDQMYFKTEDSSVTVTTDEWSLIYSVEPGVSELYHLASDPKQEKNVINERQEMAKELHQIFVKFMDERNVSPELRDPRSELRL
jgi:arylsulfatase A-like enzyme